jgi:hypothetical protein
MSTILIVLVVLLLLGGGTGDTLVGAASCSGMNARPGDVVPYPRRL